MSGLEWKRRTRGLKFLLLHVSRLPNVSRFLTGTKTGLFLVATSCCVNRKSIQVTKNNHLLASHIILSVCCKVKIRTELTAIFRFSLVGAWFHLNWSEKCAWVYIPWYAHFITALYYTASFSHIEYFMSKERNCRLCMVHMMDVYVI